jgi:hypothetical protein
MSLLLPFEVQTTEGWKQAGELREGDTVLCFDQHHGLEHKVIRQCISYYSNFTFTDYSNGSFHIAIAEGSSVSPFFSQSMSCPDNSVLAQKCSEELTDSYDPDPDLVYACNDSNELDGLQLEAVARGVHAIVEHCMPQAKLRLKEMPFVAIGPADASSAKAIAISCDAFKATHLVVRLAALEDCYKTFLVIV